MWCAWCTESTSHLSLDTFQALDSPMWLVATVLASTELDQALVTVEIDWEGQSI